MHTSKKKVKKYELIYHTIPVEPEELERRLRQAYSVLFESALKELNEKQ